MKKRAKILLAFLGVLLAAACVSLGRASQGAEYVAAAGAQSLYKLDIAQTRGTIYDCELSPLTGAGSQWVAAVAPTIQAIGALEKATDGQYRDQLAVAMENGKPFQITLERAVADPQIDLFLVPQRYQEDQLAPHIIGYLDSLGGGAAGVELAMEDALSRYQGEASVTYRVDALGRTIAGEERQVTDTLSRSQGGVALTLDSQIQALAEEAAAGLGKGAVVVTEVPDCQIRAVASVPDFSPLDLEEASQSQDSPLVNRGFSAYAPGSVFKLVTAAALLEEGLGDTTFSCVGSLNAGGLQFHCIDNTAHGELDLNGAIAKSCNCYFINAARILGGQKVLTMAYNLGFGSAQEFGRGLWTASGELPALEDLENFRALANFSFGQGALTVTPLQICAMLNAIAGDGIFQTPQLILGLVDPDRELTEQTPPTAQRVRVMGTSTARKLQKAMLQTAREGTGRAAAPEGVQVAIKTGTAQTGVMEGGEELLHFWYCGIVWQGDSPRWCVTVLKESSPDGQEAAAQAFRQVVQGLGELGE